MSDDDVSALIEGGFIQIAERGKVTWIGNKREADSKFREVERLASSTNSSYSLKKATFPTTLKSISDSAFYCQTALNQVFYGGTLVADFILPSALTEIGEEAFTGGAFVYVKLPEQTVPIAWHAFADCPNLTYIYIPATTTQIDEQAFGNMNNLTMIGKTGTTAEAYARENGYTFIADP